MRATDVFESSKVGSRSATRVVVAAPQGSRYDGRHGVIVRVVSETAFVRLDGDQQALPFGLGELKTEAK